MRVNQCKRRSCMYHPVCILFLSSSHHENSNVAAYTKAILSPAVFSPLVCSWSVLMEWVNLCGKKSSMNTREAGFQFLDFFLRISFAAKRIGKWKIRLASSARPLLNFQHCFQFVLDQTRENNLQQIVTLNGKHPPPAMRTKEQLS